MKPIDRSPCEQQTQHTVRSDSDISVSLQVEIVFNGQKQGQSLCRRRMALQRINDSDWKCVCKKFNIIRELHLENCATKLIHIVAAGIYTNAEELDIFLNILS